MVLRRVCRLEVGDGALNDLAFGSSGRASSYDQERALAQLSGVEVADFDLPAERAWYISESASLLAVYSEMFT